MDTNSPEPLPQYDQIPAFTKFGKVFVNAAPDASGRNAQAFASVISGSLSATSPTGSGNNDDGGGGGGGGGATSTTGVDTDPLGSSGYSALLVDICVNGVPKSFQILASEVVE